MQGFGNVGSWAVVALHQLGAKLTAVNDHTGTLVDPNGLDILALQKYVAQHHAIAGFEGRETLSREDFFNHACDILIPAALENQIGVTEAEQLNVRLIAEGANGPTHPDAEAILLERGVDFIPDVLANAGGVIVSYFEWVQNKTNDSWYEDEVLAKLRRRLTANYNAILEIAETEEIDLRSACYWKALKRLESVYQQRGIFP